MGKKIYLIGTSHSFQLRTPKAPLKPAEKTFKSLLNNAVLQHAVRLIGEEMSIEKVGAMQSICKEVSDELGIAHCYCDPDTIERAALGISNCDENLILAQILTRCSSGQRITREEAEKETAQVMRPWYKKREKEWLHRLLTHNQFPVLFICGANHVSFFRDLAISHDLSVTILHHDWDQF